MAKPPPTLWRQLRTFAFIILIFAAFRSAVADWNDVPSGSMMPTILEGDRIFVNKLAYDLKVPFTTAHLATWGGPQRGDVVVFFEPRDGTRLVKRVIGLPGDTIELRDNRLIVNAKESSYEPADGVPIKDLGIAGQHLHDFQWEAEPFSAHRHEVMGMPELRAPRTFSPITVPPGHYFVMGDNRDNSRDSRYIGFIDRSAIVGKAVAIVASVDVNNHWWPRWQRFFTALP